MSDCPCCDGCCPNEDNYPPPPQRFGPKTEQEQKDYDAAMARSAFIQSIWAPMIRDQLQPLPFIVGTAL